MKDLPGERDIEKLPPMQVLSTIPDPLSHSAEVGSESQGKGEGICVWNGQSWSHSLVKISLSCGTSGGKSPLY